MGPSRKLAVILHADVVHSTTLVQQDEALAHARIQDACRRFSLTIEAYNGVTHEQRGMHWWQSSLGRRQWRPPISEVYPTEEQDRSDSLRNCRRGVTRIRNE